MYRRTLTFDRTRPAHRLALRIVQAHTTLDAAAGAVEERDARSYLKGLYGAAEALQMSETDFAVHTATMNALHDAEDVPDRDERVALAIVDALRW